MTCTIRLATKSDCDNLSKLKQRVWYENYRRIYSDQKIDNFDFDKNSKKFSNIIDSPNIQLYVVEDNGELVGYMDYGTPYRPYKNFQQEIGLLYLLKTYQKKGIGRKLFNLARDAIKANGYNEFFISCNKYNFNAQKFYERMGGKIIDVDDDMDDKSTPQVKFLYKI